MLFCCPLIMPVLYLFPVFNALLMHHFKTMSEGREIKNQKPRGNTAHSTVLKSQQRQSVPTTCSKRQNDSVIQLGLDFYLNISVSCTKELIISTNLQVCYYCVVVNTGLELK